MFKTKDIPSPVGDYFKDKYKKDCIVLHFTAGYSFNSAESTLDRIDQVAVSFIVDLDGTWGLCFPKEYWAYHLGMKSGNLLHKHDKRSVGIEIVNIGPVWKRGGKFFDYVGREWPADQVVESPYSGAAGAVKFPEAQMESVCELVEALIVRLEIPRQVQKDKMTCDPSGFNFKGVSNHKKFRKDKYDIGPAFDWPRLIKYCKLIEV